MLSIKERPAEVAKRILPGHWEGDDCRKEKPFGSWHPGGAHDSHGYSNSKAAEVVAKSGFSPKGTDFNKVSRYEFKKVQNLLNGRPRAALVFQKPYEVFNQLINNAVALDSRN